MSRTGPISDVYGIRFWWLESYNKSMHGENPKILVIYHDNSALFFATEHVGTAPNAPSHMHVEAADKRLKNIVLQLKKL